MKIGIEVEGRLCGIKTLFCNELEYAIHYGEILQELDKRIDIKQVYISDLENTLDLNSDRIQRLAKEWFVTVERTHLNQPTPKNISIILNVENNSFFYLKKNDQVKFEQDLHVYSATVRNMTNTLPIEFNGDITL